MASDAQLHLRPGARRWYDDWSRYLALITVVFTLITTVLLFFIAGDELGDLKDLVTVGIGLLGLTISLQLEILFRVSERAQSRDRYARFLEWIEDYPDLFPVATETLEASVATLNGASIPQFKREVFNVLAHANARLQELAQGRLRADGLDNTLVLDRFAETESLIEGTTDEIDTAWWRTDDGQRFLRLNQELISSRNVRIERVWFLRSAPGPDVLALLEEHRESGVNVFVIRADRKDLDRRLLVNFTIMDGVFLQRNINNREGKAVEYLYSENTADLEHARSIFAQLRSRATEYTGHDSLSSVFGD